MTATRSTDSDRPRLRRDLEFTHRDADGRTEVIVYDPVTGRYFRAGELEATLFALLDGEHPVTEIAERLAAEFPGLPAEDVPPFIGQIEQMGFLEGSAVLATKPREPLHRRLLFAQWRLANPDALFDRLAPFVGWLYRPIGWVLVALLFLVAGSVAVVSREEITHQMTADLSPIFWIRIWLGLILIGTIHEFGHGLTCKHFGGRATGIGLLWMYGLPCFYCDVSGAWMLPKKSQRLWVGAAGLYYQFIAGAAAILAWRTLEPGTVLSDLLLAMATSCGLLSAFNLNPFLKLDGYYLLADWLEFPNLRRRAFDALGQQLAHFWFGEPLPENGGTARERRIGILYASLTALFVTWLTLEFTWRLGSTFVGRLSGVGLLLLVGIVGAAIGPPVVLSMAAFVRRLARWKEVAPMGRRRLLMVGGALGLVGLSLVLLPWKLHLTSPCKLEAIARSPVRARVGGRVAELRVREGTEVRRGEVIGQLATFELRKRRAERRAQLRMTRLQIAALTERLPIAAAEAERNAAEAATGAQEARTLLTEETETLPVRVAEAERRVEAATAGLQAARARLLEARASVEAQSRIATRLRGDATRAANGEGGPPSLAAAREQWRREIAVRDQARREYRRLQLLVDDGAIAQQQLDAARSEEETAARRAAGAFEELMALAKRMREEADDAESELSRRQAALQTAQAAVTTAAAEEAAAREALRLVTATSRPSRLETARLRAESRRAALGAALTARRELQAKRTEIGMRRQEAARLAAQIAVLENQIRRSALVAPGDGVVTTPRIEERIGAHFDEGDTILEIEDPRSLLARVPVNEKELGDIRVGLPVAVRVAAFPSRLYHGRVSEIAPRAVVGGSAQFPTTVVEVRLRVDNPQGELRPGMSGWAKIDGGWRPLGAVLLRRVTRYFRTEVWSWF
jgi:putative peptide zinc metalloprotease protein